MVRVPHHDPEHGRRVRVENQLEQQNAPHVSPRMNPGRSQPQARPQLYGANALYSRQGLRHKAAEVRPRYGVHLGQARISRVARNFFGS
jgi:hypothetical protein